MKRTICQGLGAAIAVAGVLVAASLHRGTAAPAPTPVAPPTRGEFMRQKLEFSKLILEGITIENFDLVAKNARNLRKLSTAAEWEVPTIPNANEYITFTAEFQRLCDELAVASKNKNLDGATLAYLRLTMSCVNCHKYVRFNRH